MIVFISNNSISNKTIVLFSTIKPCKVDKSGFQFLRKTM